MIEHIKIILVDPAIEKLQKLMAENSKVLEDRYNLELQKETEYNKKLMNEITLKQKDLMGRMKFDSLEIELPMKSKYIHGYSGIGKSALLLYWIEETKLLILNKKENYQPYYIEERELFNLFSDLKFDLKDYYKSNIEFRKYVFLDDFFRVLNWTWFQTEVSKHKQVLIHSFLELLYNNLDKHIIVVTSNNEEDKTLFNKNDYMIYRKFTDIFKDK